MTAGLTLMWLVSGTLILANVVALVLLVLGLRARSAEQLRPLGKRARLSFAIAMAGAVVFLGIGVYGIYSSFVAVDGASVDPSQKARILAEGISEAMNCIAAGIVFAPLPGVAFLVIAVRSKRLAPRG